MMGLRVGGYNSSICDEPPLMNIWLRKVGENLKSSVIDPDGKLHSN